MDTFLNNKYLTNCFYALMIPKKHAYCKNIAYNQCIKLIDIIFIRMFWMILWNNEMQKKFLILRLGRLKTAKTLEFVWAVDNSHTC